MKKAWAVFFLWINISWVVVAYPSESTVISRALILENHSVIVEGGYEVLNCIHFFGVMNPHQQPLRERIPLFYPHTMRLIKIVSGVEEGDLVFDESTKRWMIEKDFPPGKSVLALRYVMDGGSASHRLTFHVPYDMESLTFLKGLDQHFSLSMEGYKKGTPSNLKGSRLLGIMSENRVLKDTTLHLVLEGLPQDRRWFYVLGFCIVFILFLGSMVTLIWQKYFLVVGSKTS